MRADIIRQLIQAHADGDDAGFRKAALQLAAAESAAGHTRIADDLRRQVATLSSGRSRGSVVDIAQPRGELADILEGGHRDERLRDIVLSDSAESELTRVIKENRARASLERHGIQPRRKLLFHGAPGCGKTLAATVLAGEMGLPLLTVRLASLFSRFLGATANHLRSIFSEMSRRPGVYLFDEFDSIAQARGDSNDVGELRRVATAFLQLMDTDGSPSLIVAATNHPELLDRAVFRRFDVVVPFEAPSEAQIAQLVRLRLEPHGIDQGAADAARLGLGLSYADAARACDDAIRSMVLDGRDKLAEEDLVAAFQAARRRGDEQGQFHGRS
ncbi:MAG: ATP-binding protein [Sandaracinaceae bacterium]|nr:ATP-binding protein [Sandaracinaceae bacterium]